MKKKIISWILAVASMLTCVSGLSACTNPGEQSSNGGNNNPVEVDGSSSGGRLPNANLASDGTPANINGVARGDGAYKGTHIYTATDTNNYLVQNGKTDYILIAPSAYTATEKIAYNEFRELFKQATGITITATTDSKSTYQNAKNGKFIYLGRTKALAKTNIDASKETLSNDGHIVKTIDDDIYLCGGADEGTVFAVYTFMRKTFNYETYYYDCTEIDKVTTMKLKNYDIKDIPDFKFRAHSSDVTVYNSPSGSADEYNEDMFAWRLNYYGKDGQRGYNFMPIHDQWVRENGVLTPKGKSGGSTNADHWFPEYLYNDPVAYPNQYHPEWFSSQGGEQLCFSAHGDPDLYELMVDTAFEKVKAQLEYYDPTKAGLTDTEKTEYVRYNVMSLTHMDNMKYCRCDKCAEISSNNRDSQAAVQVLFMNDLAKKVNEYMETAEAKNASWYEYRKDFKLMFFAYNHNMLAPARYDAEQKKYVATDDRMYVDDRLIAWFARDANGQDQFDKGRNGEMITNLDSWCALANNVYFWHYGTNFSNYMLPYDSFKFATPEMFAYFCNKRDQFWFTQLQDNNKNTNTAWHNLKAYLEAKLAWDTSLDMDDLIENWFRAMYQEGATKMLEAFHTVHDYVHDVLVVEKGLVSYGDGSPDVVKAEHWPMANLQSWLSIIDTAKGMVSDTKVKNRMEAEALSNLYMLIEFHKDSLSSSQKTTYINRLTQDMTDLNIANMRVDSSKITFTKWLSSLS